MKNVYPIIMNKGEKFVSVYIPDFDINTQGNDMTEAIEMARDAIGILGIELEDTSKTIPEASDIADIIIEDNQVKTLVDIDFAEYRRKNSLRTVKKNCTLPSWLCYEAEKMNINFSKVLQEALKRELQL